MFLTKIFYSLRNGASAFHMKKVLIHQYYEEYSLLFKKAKGIQMTLKFIVSLYLTGVLSIASATEIEGFRDMKWGDSAKKLGISEPLPKGMSSFKKEQFIENIPVEATFYFVNDKLYNIYLLVNDREYTTTENLYRKLSNKYGTLQNKSDTSYYTPGCLGFSTQGIRRSWEWNSKKAKITFNADTCSASAISIYYSGYEKQIEDINKKEDAERKIKNKSENVL